MPNIGVLFIPGTQPFFDQQFFDQSPYQMKDYIKFCQLEYLAITPQNELKFNQVLVNAKYLYSQIW
jgi:hypothetical protein